MGKAESIAEKGRRLVRQYLRNGGRATDVPGRTIADFTGQQTTEITPSVSTVTSDMPKSPDPLGTVNLRMYSPKERAQITGLIQHYVGTHNLTLLAELSGNGKFQKNEAARKKQYLSRHPEADEADYDAQRAMQLDRTRNRTKRRINERVYSIIKENLGLESLTQAADTFEKQRKNANQAVLDHIERVYPGELRTGLRSEVSFPMRPADLLELALKSGTDPELQFEIRRLFLNTVIALHEQKGRSRIAEEKMGQIQTLLNDKFYAGKTGKNIILTVYGLFNNETNELIGEPLFESPTEAAPDGTHYKTLPLPVRELKSGGFVLQLVNQKGEGDAIRKGLRKAQERREKGQSGDVSIEEDSQDTYRERLVVIGDQAATDAVTNELLGLVLDKENNRYLYNLDVLGDVMPDIDGSPPGIPTGGGEIKFGNRGGAGQSKKVNYTKIEFRFQGLVHPIKIVTQPLKSYITEQLEVGTYDEDRGEFTGPAWKLYAQKREEIITRLLLPKPIYPELPHIQDRDKRVPSKPSLETAQKLREIRIFELD